MLKPFVTIFTIVFFTCVSISCVDESNSLHKQTSKVLKVKGNNTAYLCYSVDTNHHRITKFKEPCELYRFFKRKNVKDPDFWTRVAIIESGWDFNSELAITANNIFGFTATHDSTRSVGSTVDGWSVYKDQQQSAEDLIRLLRIWEQNTPNYRNIPESHLFAYSGYCANPTLYLTTHKQISLNCNCYEGKNDTTRNQ